MQGNEGMVHLHHHGKLVLLATAPHLCGGDARVGEAALVARCVDRDFVEPVGKLGQLWCFAVSSYQPPQVVRLPSIPAEGLQDSCIPWAHAPVSQLAIE